MLSFPRELDLGSYTSKSDQENPLMFDLYAVIVHKGSSIMSGHYETFVLSAGERWLKMNDSLVCIFLKFILIEMIY